METIGEKLRVSIRLEFITRSHQCIWISNFYLQKGSTTLLKFCYNCDIHQSRECQLSSQEKIKRFLYSIHEGIYGQIDKVQIQFDQMDKPRTP